jgi:methylphosphotriester-DNA--protein-cysteine methyltransferase
MFNVFISMIYHPDIGARQLTKQIRNKMICFAGNSRLKIYGHLHCRSGKRMKQSNRVFFSSAEEAVSAGYRPCAHCLANAYKLWVSSLA